LRRGAARLLQRATTRTLGGMASLTSLQREVLSRVAEDYEAAHTITADISRDLNRPVSEGEVKQALFSLARVGLVQAYLYDANARRYKKIDSAEAESAEEPWFMSIKGGKR
jgi:hypothetical protein